MNDRRGKRLCAGAVFLILMLVTAHFAWAGEAASKAIRAVNATMLRFMAT